MIEIYSGPFYTINSEGNGARVTITRLADGASVFLQGDDAVSFIDAVEHAYDRDDADTPLHDLCATYDDVMEGPSR